MQSFKRRHYDLCRWLSTAQCDFVHNGALSLCLTGVDANSLAIIGYIAKNSGEFVGFTLNIYEESITLCDQCLDPIGFNNT